jgi:hypothetical protein
MHLEDIYLFIGMGYEFQVLKKTGGITLKVKLYAFSIICLVYSIAFSGNTVDLPANSRIFFSEEDCIEGIKSHYSWNIEFATTLRDMENSGKLIRYPQKVPINIIETKVYKSHKYYKISIFDRLTKQYEIVWTDAVKLN